MLEELASKVSPRILHAPKRLDDAARQLGEYFAGHRHHFGLPIDLSLSSGFRRIVLTYLPAIEYGKTASYGDVAAAVHNPKASSRRDGLRYQPAAPDHPVSPGDPFRRSHRLLSRRPREKTATAESRGRWVSAVRSDARAPSAWRRRVDSADWTMIAAEVDEFGCALTPQLLSAADATRLIGIYDKDDNFRSTVNMGRHRFGQGEYRYLSRPLPEPIEQLRQALYLRLLPIAREWHTKLGRPSPWPDTLDEWLDLCHVAGQTKPTPLMLKYEQGDWNALHRDLYGDLVFPLQVVVNLTKPGVDYTGGEFVLVEQRPRAQSRATTISPFRGQGLIFTTRDRPVEFKRGWSASPVRHGVSVVRSGHRFTLGLLFHDAT